MFHRMVPHSVVLSPDHVWLAYLCVPSGPDRDTTSGRRSGACARSASSEARAISSVCTARPCAPIGPRAGPTRAKPWSTSYSLLSFHTPAQPRSSSCARTCAVQKA
jgi:hypothetical protein